MMSLLLDMTLCSWLAAANKQHTNIVHGLWSMVHGFWPGPGPHLLQVILLCYWPSTSFIHVDVLWVVVAFMCFGRTPLSMAKWYLVLVHGTCTIKAFTWYLVLVHYMVYGTWYLALWPMGTWYLAKSTIKALWAIHVQHYVRCCGLCGAKTALNWRNMAMNLGNVWQFKQVCQTSAAA